MKIGNAVLLLSIGLLFSQCNNEKVVTPPRPDYNKLEIEAMTQLTPQLLGTWEMSRVHMEIQRYNYGQEQAGILRDTTFQNFAVLSIRLAAVRTSTPPQPRYPDFEGDLTFRGKAYPIKFTTRPTSRVVTGQGPLAFLSLQFDLAPGTYPPHLERDYLRNVGLVNETFGVEMLAGEKGMIWRGEDRGVVKIEMQKR